MVNIIDFFITINQLYHVLNNLNNIFIGQHTGIQVNVKP